MLATRDVHDDFNATLLARLTTHDAAEVVRLSPLSGAAVGRWVEGALGAAADPLFVRACHRATGGTPFLLRELASALRDDGVAPTAASAAIVDRLGPETVRRWMLLRLGRLPASAARLARILAVLERADLRHAAELAGLSVDEAGRAADVLAHVEILEPGRPLVFVHSIVRAAIYGEIPLGERSHLHRVAASVLSTDLGSAEAAAEHLLAAEPAGDRWVVQCLVDAARMAAGRGAPEAAVAYLHRAIAEPPPVTQQASLLLRLGVSEAASGRPGALEHLEASYSAATTGAEQLQAASALAEQLGWNQRYEESVAMLDRAAGAVDPVDRHLSVLLEVAAVSVGQVYVETARRLGDRRQRLRDLALSDPSPPRELLAYAANASVQSNQPAAVGADLARRALRAGGRPTPGPGSLAWFASALSALSWAGHDDEIGPVLETAIADAQAAGDVPLLSHSLCFRALVARHRGDLAAAETDARTALHSDLPTPTQIRLLAAANLIVTLSAQGRFDGAEALVGLRPQAADNSHIAADLSYSIGCLRQAQGRSADALAHFAEVGRITTATFAISPCCTQWRSKAARAHLALGDRRAAEQLAAEELDLARRFGSPRPLGIALHTLGVIKGARDGETLLSEAIACFEAAGAGLKRAEALTDLGAMLRRANRRAEARPMLREALDFSHKAGARPLAERAETELRATGARPRRVVLTGAESLTASERRVAELAGRGMTNRDIAQTLFITQRTVEGHLTHIFAKLDVTTRAALSDTLASARP